MDNPENKIYKSVKGLTEALSQAGLYREEEVSTPDEIKHIKSTIKIHSWVIIGVFIVVFIAFIGFIFDALYFHINNSKYFDNVYELKNNQKEQIDQINKDLDFLKEKHPELFD